MKRLQLDLRVKLLASLVLSTCALCAGHIHALIALLAITVLILPVCAISPAVLFKKLRGVFGLTAAIFCAVCLLNRTGEPWLTLGGLTFVTKPGANAAAAYCLRFSVVMLGVVIIMGGKTRDYLLVMTQCGLPYEMAYTVIAALRFLPVLRETVRELLSAAQLRGLKIKNTGPRKRVGAYISILLSAFSCAIRRAGQVSTAMEARAFRAFPNRTYMRRLKAGTFDWIFSAALTAALTAVFIYLN